MASATQLTSAIQPLSDLDRELILSVRDALLAEIDQIAADATGEAWGRALDGRSHEVFRRQLAWCAVERGAIEGSDVSHLEQAEERIDSGLEVLQDAVPDVAHDGALFALYAQLRAGERDVGRLRQAMVQAAAAEAEKGVQFWLLRTVKRTAALVRVWCTQDRQRALPAPVGVKRSRQIGRIARWTQPRARSPRASRRVRRAAGSPGRPRDDDPEPPLADRPDRGDA